MTESSERNFSRCRHGRAERMITNCPPGELTEIVEVDNPAQPMTEAELREANKAYYYVMAGALFEGFPVPFIGKLLTRIVAEWGLNVYVRERGKQATSRQKITTGRLIFPNPKKDLDSNH